MSRPVRIQLLGQTYTIRTNETDEHIAEVKAMLDGRFDELRGRGAPADQALAVLTALTLADDLVKARQKDAQVRGELLRGIDALMEQAAAQ